MLSTYLGRESEARGGGGASVPLIPGSGCSPHHPQIPFQPVNQQMRNKL